jgi:endoglucanase
VTPSAAPAFEERFLERFSEESGVSGGEERIRAAIIESVKDSVDSLEIDAMGSLVARIDPDPARARPGSRGRGKSRPHLMLCAHMDEIGAMVFAIEKDGRLRFRKVGGIDNRILVGQALRVGPERISGVVGSLPPHLVSRADREKVTPVEDLYIDIGADSREEAAARVSVGDYATFDTRYERWGQTRKGKAFDDRVGCAVLASVVQRRPPIPVTAVWSVQEEVGLRGAAAAARRVAPDLAIVLEGTAAGDAPGMSREEAAPWMGHGPALTVQDRSLMADARLVDRIERTAKQRKIPTQWKRPGIGGTDAGRIALSGAGVPSAVISVPCRYIHAPAAYLDIRDARRTVELVWHTMITLTKEWP